MPKSRQVQNRSHGGDSSGSGEQRAQTQSGPQFPPGFNPVTKAQQLYEAFDGWGTDERAVLDLLYTGSHDLTGAIESAYNARYSTSLKQRIHDELSGDYLQKALKLLGQGRFTLSDKLKQAADGWGTDEAKIFNALERATEADLAQVRADAYLMQRLRGELSGTDLQLAMAFLNGQGALAAKLRRSVDGWGTDEAAIWRALEKSTQTERDFVLSQPSLMSHLSSDLNDSDYLRAKRMLTGAFDNADRIEVAMAGWGTDEAGLVMAIGDLSSTEFGKLTRGSARLPGIGALAARLDSELSGADLVEARELLHQKRLAFDSAYQERFMAQQTQLHGEDAMSGEGASVLTAGDGQTMSAVGRIKVACKGMGTDDEALWAVLASMTPAQGRFILDNNPSGVLDTMRGDLSATDFIRARSALGGGAAGTIAVLRSAVEGAGTDERLLYDAMDRVVRDGLGPEILKDSRVMGAVRGDVSATQFQVFRAVLSTGAFGPMQRLQWATAMAGTDEDLIYELCQQYGSAWFVGGAIDAEVDAILLSELKTRDYWRAIDLIRGDPEGEQDRLARAKELLERERGGVSTALMDSFSVSGQNADDAWREYQGTYNVSLRDGQVTESEQKLLRRDEEHSQFMTSEYRAAKASVAQWASQIAVAIVGIAATILTAGAAGPFVAGLAAQLGGSLAVTCEAMVLAAALKVGITKAVEGEGYDLSSSDALVDGVGASIEAGLFVVGNLAAAKMMAGIGKSGVARSVGPSVERVFGRAGKRILSSGLDGSIDGTFGGVGEGLFRGLANEQSWSSDLGGFFSNVGATTMLHGAMGTVSGFAGGAMFRSMGETFGPAIRRRFGGKGMPAKGQGQADDILERMPDELAKSSGDQRRLLDSAYETNQRMQGIADEVSGELGIDPIKTGLKGNDFGAKADQLDQDEFIKSILEKTQRAGAEPVGAMKDMSRARFDTESFAQAQDVADALASKLEWRFGADNVKIKPPRDVYKRFHILARDPHTGVWHEFQVGTKALTDFIEGQRVKLPPGVELHAKPDFHVVKYDVLDKLSKPEIRAQHGLPDDIAARVGLDDLSPRYDALMLEAGMTARGKPEPPNFGPRMEKLGDDLADVLARLERERPGIINLLDTKGGGAVGPTQAAGLAPRVPDMPAPSGAGKGTTTPKQVDSLPGLREDHAGKFDYADHPNAQAFGPSGQVDPMSVKQGRLGDCYLMAGCAANARARGGDLKKLIKDNGDGTFDVTLHLRDASMGQPKPVVVTVDGRLPVMGSGGKPLYAGLNSTGEQGDEMWTALIEKALAQHKGSYQAISGVNIGKGMDFHGTHELLSGKSGSQLVPQQMPDDILLRRISYALDNNEPITAGTIDFKADVSLNAAANKSNVYANHAYAIEKVDLEKGTIDLQNPWGFQHVRGLSVDDFKRYYRKIDIGQKAPSSKGPVKATQ